MAKFKNTKKHPTLPFLFVTCIHSGRTGGFWPAEVCTSQDTGCRSSKTEKQRLKQQPDPICSSLAWEVVKTQSGPSKEKTERKVKRDEKFQSNSKKP